LCANEIGFRIREQKEKDPTKLSTRKSEDCRRCYWIFKADCSRQVVGHGYGQSDRDLHTEELPETVEMDSTPPTRTSDRVLLADEEISLAQNNPLSETWWA
jgi:hypothetical protein